MIERGRSFEAESPTYHQNHATYPYGYYSPGGSEYRGERGPPPPSRPPPPRYGGNGYPPPANHVSPAPSYEETPPRYPPPTYSPYTYVQQPKLEEKTILRKKFSWKHYKELESFLIANRDEYLRHSAMNYTAEQKQYNNWLTERVLEVAKQYNYVFDPDEFNFVAIRDRIRCYYKSYVQTARKRGVPILPVTSRKAATEHQESHEEEHQHQQEQAQPAEAAPAHEERGEPQGKTEETGNV